MILLDKTFNYLYQIEVKRAFANVVIVIERIVDLNASRLKDEVLY